MSYPPPVELAIVLTIDGENPTVGDLRLSGGNLAWLSDLAAETAQRLTVRLNFFKDEWFFDRNQGIPYYQQLFVKEPDPSVVRAIFSQVILGTQGIATLDSLTIGEPNADREVDITFQARLTDGTRFRSGDFGPFIVRVP